MLIAAIAIAAFFVTTKVAISETLDEPKAYLEVTPELAEYIKNELKNRNDEVFQRIAMCESGNNARAQNPTSTASGRFQFLDSSWEYYGKMLWGDEWVEKDKLNWYDNTDLAWFTYQKEGIRPWLASQHCWNV